MLASHRAIELIRKSRLWKTAQAALANIAYNRMSAADKLAPEAAARKRDRKNQRRINSHHKGTT